MTTQKLVRELESALAEVPILDVHTHLVGIRLVAHGLHDVLLYHIVVTKSCSAGCPSGARLTQHPGWPTTGEAHAKIQRGVITAGARGMVIGCNVRDFPKITKAVAAFKAVIHDCRATERAMKVAGLK